MPSPVWQGQPEQPAFSPSPHPSRRMSAASSSITPGIRAFPTHRPTSLRTGMGQEILTESPTTQR